MSSQIVMVLDVPDTEVIRYAQSYEGIVVNPLFEGIVTSAVVTGEIQQVVYKGTVIEE